MSLAEVLPNVRELSRTDKLRLLQVLAQDLLESDPLALLQSGQSYPIESPDLAFEAGQTLMSMLEAERKQP